MLVPSAGPNEPLLYQIFAVAAQQGYLIKWCVSSVCFGKSSYRSAYVYHKVAEIFVRPHALRPAATLTTYQ